ncbi:hypothetical protein ACHAL6_05430 [Proteiniclasticum sp. C24MP]|uniref:hypothetical protein n=1 Tax=Proteiniclasticum sp. C24MP TaxID=3374101 RepID=UPI0037548AC0
MNEKNHAMRKSEILKRQGDCFDKLPCLFLFQLEIKVFSMKKKETAQVLRKDREEINPSMLHNRWRGGEDEITSASKLKKLSGLCLFYDREEDFMTNFY